MISSAAFFDELEKIAYSFKDMRKVLSLSAKKTMKLPPEDLLIGPAALPRTIDLKEVHNKLVGAGLGEHQISSVDQLQRNSLGKMQMPRNTGGVVGYLRGMGLPTPAHMSGQQHVAVESLLRGHELDELQIGGRKLNKPYMAAATHTSPDVYLREHNRVVTSPPEVQDALRTVMGPFRTYENHAMKSVSPNLTFGQGPRLSRHARKHLTESLTAKTLQPGFQAPGNVAQGLAKPLPPHASIDPESMMRAMAERD